MNNEDADEPVVLSQEQREAAERREANDTLQANIEADICDCPMVPIMVGTNPDGSPKVEMQRVHTHGNSPWDDDHVHAA